MQVGNRVRVNKSVMVFHHPKHKPDPVDLAGWEGTVTAILGDWEGRPISPNLPIVVKFSPKFKAHFRENEVALIE
ncbi:MAG: ferredoxin-thioredoxin reductase variable chain [Cyanobacteria bacterium P01_H01_bin.15]